MNAMAILRSASTIERASIRVVCGWTQTASGKEREVYASVTLRKLETAEITAMNSKPEETALAVLATMGKVNLSLPATDKGATLRVALARTMPGDFAAVLFAHLSKRDVPKSIKPERVKEALLAGGIETADKAPRKAKVKTAEETAAAPAPEANGKPS